MSKAIDVAGLRKSYGKVTALDGLDLNVASGEVHGFLGPNGAGKTTTIRILLGLLRSDGGSARLLGGDPWTEATTLHRRLAYVPGDVSLWPNFSGGEVIDLLGRLRGGLDETRLASLLKRFELDPSVKARAYSKGNRQKVALIAALASDVELLMLDEPTAGLDPLMEAPFPACITEERGRGRTVLLSSHILSEGEALCDRLTIIRRGRAGESGTRADLRHLTRPAFWAGHNPALLSLYGPLFGNSIGSLTAWRYGGFAALGAGLMSIFIVIRHTRADEETGRLELVGSAAVGRNAALAAALVIAVGANPGLAVLITVALTLLRPPIARSLALALAIAGSGLVFTAVAAACAQIAGRGPGARGLAIGVVGVTYLLRAIGDSAGPHGPRWRSGLSAIGWAQLLRSVSPVRWWVLALPGLVAVVAAGSGRGVFARH